MRLAWFSPWPPQTSGVAGRSVDVTRALAERGHAVDVFVDVAAVPAAGRAPNDAPAPGDVRLQSAHDFVWRHHRAQYDLVVYQIGNSTAHAFIWPYLLRYPGLTIVHDAHLHHSRGAMLLRPSAANAYRAALGLDHPDLSPDIAELAIAGFDGSYYYLWPMVRAAVLASRAVGVHARGAAAMLREIDPAAVVEHVALGMGRAAPPAGPAARTATRQRLGVPPDALLVGTFGGLTPDKRVPQILRAFAALRRLRPDAHLLLAGAPDSRLDLPRALGAPGLEGAVTLATSLDDETFEDAIAAVDISLHLRWPTARETSGPWLQALAAGRATVVFDLAHQAHLPVLDPQTWQPRPPAVDAPIAVALDILDEQHSLGLALVRLASDAALRSALGSAARAYWEREHTVERMVDDYVRLIARAAACAPGASRLPADARIDPCRTARDLAGPAENLTCTLF